MGCIALQVALASTVNVVRSGGVDRQHTGADDNLVLRFPRFPASTHNVFGAQEAHVGKEAPRHCREGCVRRLHASEIGNGPDSGALFLLGSSWAAGRSTEAYAAAKR